jgi:hypothetical protein
MRTPELLAEFLTFLRQNKLMWGVPILLFLALMFALLIFTGDGGTLLPFVYSLR